MKGGRRSYPVSGNGFSSSGLGDGVSVRPRYRNQTLAVCHRTTASSPVFNSILKAEFPENRCGANVLFKQVTAAGPLPRYVRTRDKCNVNVRAAGSGCKQTLSNSRGSAAAMQIDPKRTAISTLVLT
jgi:hypothetical protein